MNESRFLITDKMPYEPSALRIPRYTLPSLFSKAEKEEAAARLFSLIHEKGEWTGVTWRELSKQMMADLEERSAMDRAMKAYNESLRLFEKAVMRWWALSIMTLGFYGLLTKKPVEPRRPERKPIPFTVIFFTGPLGVAEGLQGLIADGLIREERVGEDHAAEDVFYPTVQLVNMLAGYTVPLESN